MDLAFTPEEEAFRQEVRAWVHANLPQELSHKVHNALRLTREDMQQWARILGNKNWLGYGWPTQFGGPGWTAVQKHLFEEECALAGAPRLALDARRHAVLGQNFGHQGLVGLRLAHPVWRPRLERGAKTFVRRGMRAGGCSSGGTVWSSDGRTGHHGVWQCRTTAAVFAWHCQR